MQDDVLIEYIGVNRADRVYRGSVGGKYIFGANAAHQIQAVARADAPNLLRLKIFRDVAAVITDSATDKTVLARPGRKAKTKAGSSAVREWKISRGGQPLSTIAVVLLIWERDPAPLRHALAMLHAQTLPPLEVVVVNASATPALSQAATTLCAEFPLAREILAPSAVFNLSWGINVGLRHVTEQAHFVMCTGMEMLLSHDYLWQLAQAMDEDEAEQRPSFGMSYCGFLPDSVKVTDPVAQWPGLLACCPELPPHKVSTGALMVATRAWWHEVHGWNEQIPFAYSDANITARAAASGLSFGVLPWAQAQLLHQWHAPSELVRSLGGTLAEHLARPIEIVANPDGWGEIA